MSEKNDWNQVKNKIFTYKDRVNRIENIAGSGMPDVNYCVDGSEGWIEFKSPTEPIRKTSKLFGANHKLLQSQKNWFLKQRNARGKAFIFISTDKRYMLLGIHQADLLNDMTVDELVLHSLWHVRKPVRDNSVWIKLRKLLK